MKKYILFTILFLAITNSQAASNEKDGSIPTNNWYTLVNATNRPTLPQRYISAINKLHALGVKVDTNVNFAFLQWVVDLKSVKTGANLVFVLQHHPNSEEETGLQIEMSQAAIHSFLKYLEPREIFMEGLEREVSTNKEGFIGWCNRDLQPQPSKEEARENMLQSIWGCSRYAGSSTNEFSVVGIEDVQINRNMFEIEDFKKSHGSSRNLDEAVLVSLALRDCLGMKILSEHLRENPGSNEVAYIIGGLHGKSLRIIADELKIPHKSISLVFTVNAN